MSAVYCTKSQRQYCLQCVNIIWGMWIPLIKDKNVVHTVYTHKMQQGITNPVGCVVSHFSREICIIQSQHVWIFLAFPRPLLKHYRSRCDILNICKWLDWRNVILKYFGNYYHPFSTCRGINLMWTQCKVCILIVVFIMCVSLACWVH